MSVEQCETSHVKCQAGMFAPLGAKSEQECVCMAGHGGKHCGCNIKSLVIWGGTRISAGIVAKMLVHHAMV